MFIRCTSPVLLSLCLLAPVALAKPSPRRASDKLTSAAAASLTHGDPTQALVYANGAIAIDPGDPWAHYDKGAANNALGNTDAAIESFSTAEALFGADNTWGRSLAIYGRARARELAGACTEARGDYLEYAKLVRANKPSAAQLALEKGKNCKAKATVVASVAPAGPAALAPPEAPTIVSATSVVEPSLGGASVAPAREITASATQAPPAQPVAAVAAVVAAPAAPAAAPASAAPPPAAPDAPAPAPAAPAPVDVTVRSVDYRAALIQFERSPSTAALGPMLAALSAAIERAPSANPSMLAPDLDQVRALAAEVGAAPEPTQTAITKRALASASNALVIVARNVDIYGDGASAEAEALRRQVAMIDERSASPADAGAAITSAFDHAARTLQALEQSPLR